MTGPLSDVRVVEFAGIGPGPLCAMTLADMGADVVRIDRVDMTQSEPFDPRLVMTRGRRSVQIDIRSERGRELALALVERSELLIEGFRPGVMERLALGPAECHARNPALVYGRITGWGQDGPYAQMAGHDINYIAIAGALGQIGRAGEPPVVPLNLVGDFGGGAMLLAVGLLAGLAESRRTGRGPVVDAAMTEGVGLLSTMFHELLAMGWWRDERGVNSLAGASPHYATYECADGEYVAVGTVEPHFYAELLQRVGLTDVDPRAQNDRAAWPDTHDRLAEVFLSKSRAEWCALLEGTDSCFAPVLSMREAHEHPHNVHRRAFVEADGIVQPAPAPRFSSAPVSSLRPKPRLGQHTEEVLAELGLAESERSSLRASGVVR